MVFQEYNLVERLTVMENLLSGRLGYVSAWRAWRRKFPPEDIRGAYELLDLVGLAGFAHQRADALSGGQRQRVGIARAVMQEPKLLLADEPTSSLDPKTSVEIMELLTEVARSRGIPVLINMHDVELARRFADRIIGMRDGRIVFDGPPGGAHRRDADDDLRRRGLAAMTAEPGDRGRRTDAPPADPFRRSVWPRVAAVALVVYVIYACAQLEVSWERVETGLENAAKFFSRLFPPNFSRWDLLVKGLVGEPGDRGARVDARHRARAAHRPLRRPQSDAARG